MTTTQEQQTALDIIRTSSSIATPEQLAALISNSDLPKYCQIPEGTRRRWLAQQVSALYYMTHSARPVNEFDLTIEVSMLDQAIMDDNSICWLTQVEMQEAFRKGIVREYGEFYGITVTSLIGFLRGFLNSEKRRKAKAIIFAREQKELKEGDERFWKELHEARKRGFELPEFTFSPTEPDDAHKERIQQQRKIIYQNQKHNGSKENHQD